MTRILTIEDHPGIRKLISLTLQFEGYQVLEAEDGHQGVALAQAQQPDLALIDVMLPGAIDGLQACRLLRESPALSAMPIILLSALGGDKHQRKGLEAGANLYLVKPFRPIELIDTVGQLLRQVNTQRTLG